MRVLKHILYIIYLYIIYIYNDVVGVIITVLALFNVGGNQLINDSLIDFVVDRGSLNNYDTENINI